MAGSIPAHSSHRVAQSRSKRVLYSYLALADCGLLL